MDEVGPLRDLAAYEAVPYLLVMESVERDGEWLRRAEYPELGCAAEAPDAVEAFERLERLRRRMLRQWFDEGTPIPVPRPPIRWGAPTWPPDVQAKGLRPLAHPGPNARDAPAEPGRPSLSGEAPERTRS